MSEETVIEIRRGSGEPRYLALTPGEQLPPTSVGLRADWRIEANGVADRHAFLYFDGTTLFVQSAGPTAPLRVNGRPVPDAWTAVEPPCTLALGEARLIYCPVSQATMVAGPSVRPAAGRALDGRALDDHAAHEEAPQASIDDGATLADVPKAAMLGAQFGAAQPARTKPKTLPPRSPRRAPPTPEDDATRDIPVPSHSPSHHAMGATGATGATGVGAPPEGSPDDETTRALPLPSIVQGMVQGRPQLPTTPRHDGGALRGEPEALEPIGFAPPVVPPEAPAPSPDASQPIAAPPLPKVEPPAKPSPLAQMRAQWKEASLPKRAILVLLPVAFVAVVFGLDDEPEPAAKKPQVEVVAAKSSANDGTAKTAPKSPEDDEEPKPKTTKVAESTSAAPLKPAPQPTTQTTTQPAPQTNGGATSAAKTAGSVKSPERAAVDAVAAGNWEMAANLYEQLAKDRPEVRAYGEAARILRAKAKK
jgi:hypothetical protein